MLKKLRIKFVCILMVVVTVLLCVIFGMVIRFTEQNLEQQSMEALQRAAAEPGPMLNPNESGSILPYFIMQQDMRGTLRVSGTIQFDSYGEEVLQAVWNGVNSADAQSGVLEAYDLRFLRVNSPVGVRYVFLDISSQRTAMASLTRVCIFVGIISFALMLGISILLARWAVKPVEKAWEQQRQFVADASHELKTPLTVIMTNAELLQTAQQDEAARQQFSASILTMSRQMRGLVEGLLELARVDNGAVKSNFSDVDWSLLVSDGVLPFEPVYFEKGLALIAEIAPDIGVRGSVQHLHQVLEILLDNAMKYAHPQSEIRVTLRRQGNHAVLTVANPGPPISDEDLRNIFKRFYRVDKARSRNGSYGLGLSIAESIISEHGGKIWAESENGINTFFVQLNTI